MPAGGLCSAGPSCQRQVSVQRCPAALTAGGVTAVVRAGNAAESGDK